MAERTSGLTSGARDATPFEDLGLLGRGGSGEVRRVLDPALGRTMALKTMRAAPDDPGATARFIEEARVTAQLEHPGILPVHQLGERPDGTPWFTMKEVRGRTLDLVVREVHGAVGPEGWRPAPSGWTFRRLLDAFHRVCQAVAYAHSRGILHRDLKPQNVMVGDFGEVLVLDWGLARVVGASAQPDTWPSFSPTSPLMSAEGDIIGTPAYMSPEQAKGEHQGLTPASDVYALGGILFEILTGKVPFFERTPYLTLVRVRQGLCEPLVSPAPVPDELVALCRRAMRLEPGERPADAGALAAAMADWLEGARKTERALELVAESDRQRQEAQSLHDQARARNLEAAAILGALPTWAPVEQKRPGWLLEDEAARLERAATLAELASTQLLAAALEESPDLPEAYQRLADYYHHQHAEAEARGDAPAATRYEVLLRTYDRGRYASWLRGDAALSLITDPAGVEALLFRYERQDRRLVPVFLRALGRTPLREVSLEAGSYLVLLRPEGRPEVRYPVMVGRGEHWDGVPPGSAEPAPVSLPASGVLGPDDVYVPAGWFGTGELTRNLVPGALPPGRLWLDGFVIRRYPVTQRELLELVNGLVEQGRGEEALALAPRLLDSETLAYGQDDRGRFFLTPDPQGDLWDADYPAFMVTWEQARRISEALGQRSARPWRLPYEAEWEKAARGVDRRSFPWGDFGEPTWACLRDSVPGRILPAPVTAFPIDEGPFGVRGMAGGVSDWCLGPFQPDHLGTPGGGAGATTSPTVRVVARGGAFAQFIGGGRLSRRVGHDPSFRSHAIGLRLARDLV